MFLLVVVEGEAPDEGLVRLAPVGVQAGEERERVMVRELAGPAQPEK